MVLVLEGPSTMEGLIIACKFAACQKYKKQHRRFGASVFIGVCVLVCVYVYVGVGVCWCVCMCMLVLVCVCFFCVHSKT